MEFNRITLTKSNCRTLEYQISQEEVDENGKLKNKRVSPKEGRKLDKVLDEFLKASDDFDENYEKILNNVRAQSSKFAKKLAEAKNEEDKAQVNQEINAFNLEVQDTLEVLEEAAGKDVVNVDLSDSDLELVNKYWNELDTPRGRKIRKQLALVTEALTNPTKLELVDGQYVPKSK